MDPRGYSRSVLDPGPPADIEVEVQSEDAHSLLEHLTPAGEAAYVFGGSGGAVVALDLLARHPQRLRLVIAHEPPSFGVLPDAAEHKAFVEEVYELFRTEGLAAAGARFLEGIGGGVHMPDPAGLSPRAAAMIERLHANAPRNMAHELRPITSYLPDVAALATVADRLVLGAGRDSKGKLPRRPAEALAAQLDIPLTEFPGGHSGFTNAPAELRGCCWNCCRPPAWADARGGTGNANLCHTALARMLRELWITARTRSKSGFRTAQSTRHSISPNEIDRR
ncbi:alpha/beta fold hydrolase [Nocardia asiatica]|uniref:alpha/beta fold hydrolase n=1 Tax=Nocardia asiatica TaxID=209252 RepID=UPI002454288E|nr:alpha/beta hydrolase [Nocardia asiatica]